MDLKRILLNYVAFYKKNVSEEASGKCHGNEISTNYILNSLLEPANKSIGSLIESSNIFIKSF